MLFSQPCAHLLGGLEGGHHLHAVLDALDGHQLREGLVRRLWAPAGRQARVQPRLHSQGKWEVGSIGCLVGHGACVYATAPSAITSMHSHLFHSYSLTP